MIAKGILPKPTNPSEQSKFDAKNRADVASYRRSNRHVMALWRTLERGLEESVGADFVLRLPSGRSMRYESVKKDGNGFRALVRGPGKMREIRLWGGILTENLVSATSRDVFRDGVIAAERAGFPVLLRVHDEILTMVPERDAEKRARELKNLLRTSPPWLRNAPLESTVQIATRYAK
jgi:hypothetical protein